MCTRKPLRYPRNVPAAQRALRCSASSETSSTNSVRGDDAECSVAAKGRGHREEPAAHAGAMRLATHDVRKGQSRCLCDGKSKVCATLPAVSAEDAREAARWYRKAAEQGAAYAQFALGVAYEIGAGVPKDAVQAYAWYNLSAAQGNEDAARNRTDLERYMTAAQIAQAQELSRELVD